MEVWGIKRERRKIRKRIDKLEERLDAQYLRFEADESAPEDREDAWARIGEIEYELKKLDLKYKDSAKIQTDALIRLEEATKQAKNDGYSDDGGYLQKHQDLKKLGDMFD